MSQRPPSEPEMKPIFHEPEPQHNAPAPQLLKDGKPYDKPFNPLPPLQPQEKRKGSTLKAILGLAGILLIVVIVGGVISERTKKHEVVGIVVIQGADNFYTKDGRCLGVGGFEDIEYGATVSLLNESNTIIASGTLELGTAGTTICRHEFTIKDVPNAKYYQVRINQRGGPTYTQADLEESNWSLGMLTLGS